jgi:hypothetical protein
VFLINRYRDPNVNLRTQLQRILRRAGVAAWPKLFHNLRASRETELAAQYPLHVAYAWIGNSERIAQKHYLQVTEEGFQRATYGACTGGAKSGAVGVQKAVQSVYGRDCQGSQEMTQALENKGFMQILTTVVKRLQVNRLPPRGLETSHDSPGKTGVFEQGGANSGARFEDFRLSNSDLARIIDAWPMLPAHVKAAILTLVGSVERSPDQ